MIAADAIERAKSRAAVLQSLQDAYGSSSSAVSLANSKPVDSDLLFGNSLRMKQSKSESNISDRRNGSNRENFEGYGRSPGLASIASASASISDGVALSSPAGEKQKLESVIACITDAVGDSCLKSVKFFRDSLRGKAIVVENTKSQAIAAKSLTRTKINFKRSSVKLSNSKRKRLRIGYPGAYDIKQSRGGIMSSQLYGSLNPAVHGSDTSVEAKCRENIILTSNIAAQTLRIQHDASWEYLRTLCSRCKNPAQLQSRLISAELVGVLAYVVEYRAKPSWVGRRGVISSVTQNCFILHAVDYNEDTYVKQHLEGSSHGNSSSGSGSSGNSSDKNVDQFTAQPICLESSLSKSSAEQQPCQQLKSTSGQQQRHQQKGTSEHLQQQQQQTLRTRKSTNSVRLTMMIAKDEAVIGVVLPNAAAKADTQPPPSLITTSGSAASLSEIEHNLRRNFKHYQLRLDLHNQKEQRGLMHNATSSAKSGGVNAEETKLCLLYGSKCLPHCTRSSASGETGTISATTTGGSNR